MRENHGAEGEVTYHMCDNTAWGLRSQAVLLTAVSLMLIVAVVVSLLVLTHLWALDAYRV
jgi:hypothetical protein